MPYETDRLLWWWEQKMGWQVVKVVDAVECMRGDGFFWLYQVQLNRKARRGTKDNLLFIEEEFLLPFVASPNIDDRGDSWLTNDALVEAQTEFLKSDWLMNHHKQQDVSQSAPVVLKSHNILRTACFSLTERLTKNLVVSKYESLRGINKLSRLIRSRHNKGRQQSFLLAQRLQQPIRQTADNLSEYNRSIHVMVNRVKYNDLEKVLQTAMKIKKQHK